MSLSVAGAKVAVDLLLKATGRLFKAKGVADSEAALAQLIRELIQIDPDLAQATATIARAKAKGINSPNLYIAQGMLRKVSSHKRAKSAATKTAAGPSAKRTVAKASAKRAAPKKAVKKAVARKMAGKAARKSAR